MQLDLACKSLRRSKPKSLLETFDFSKQSAKTVFSWPEWYADPFEIVGGVDRTYAFPQHQTFPRKFEFSTVHVYFSKVLTSPP